MFFRRKKYNKNNINISKIIHNVYFNNTCIPWNSHDEAKTNKIFKVSLILDL